MVSDLDDLVEQLAARLGRSVAIDDAQLRLLSYSRHYETPDRARLDALIARRAPAALAEYARLQRIHQWRSPGVLRANPDVGLDRDRIGVPLRSERAFLGYLWVVVDDDPLSDGERELVDRAAQAALELLERRARETSNEARELARLVDDLLTGPPATRERALVELVERRVFADVGRLAVLAFDSGNDPPSRTQRDTWFEAITASHRGPILVCSRGRHAVVGLLSDSPDREATEIGTRTADAARRSRSAATRIAVGVGATVEDLSQAASAAHQALVAARMARVRGVDVVSWSDSPVDALIGALTSGSIPSVLVPEMATRIDGRPSREIDTVRLFFESGGNADAAADALHIHRATVYYRLQRFAAGIGASLADPETRLFVELWLRARVAIDDARDSGGEREPGNEGRVGQSGPVGTEGADRVP